MFTVPETRQLLPDLQGTQSDAFEWICLTGAESGDAHGERRVIDPAWRLPARAPTVIVGTPVLPDCLQGLPKQDGVATGPAVYLQQIENARPVGYEAVLGGDGALYTTRGKVTAGAAAEGLAKRTLAGHHGYVLIQDDGRQMLGVRPNLRPERLAQTALFLGALEPDNFGSFLLRVLPQMLVQSEERVACDVIIVPARTPWILEALALLGLDDCPVLSVKESAGFCFNRLCMVQNTYQVGAFGPDMRARLDRLAQSCAAFAPVAAKRLYISRALQSVARPSYRNLLNEREIETRLRAQGFAIFTPETWQLKRQIGMFAAAEDVVGPSGSGTLLSAFAAEGARVLELESYSLNVVQHARLYATTGKHYGFAFGATEPETSAPDRRAWRLDPEILDQAMAGLKMH